MTTRVLITGCSGAGKSTLLAEMAQRGWATVPEPGRRVIAAECKAGRDGLPWANTARFLNLCLDMAVADWKGATGITLFDRGLLEPCLALRRAGHPAAFEQFRSYDVVVLADPWPEIYTTDQDRRHGLAAALPEYEDIKTFLDRNGPSPWILPKTGPSQRAEWLESRLKAL